MQGIVLGIETSNPSAWAPGNGPAPGVALARVEGSGKKAILPLGIEPIDLSRPHHDDLMGAIDRLTRRAGVRPAGLRAVAVSIGPGGFTSLRVAIAAGKIIAEATGAECFPVATAAVAARRIEWPGPFAVVLASKGETAFVTRFDAGRKGHDPGMLMDASGISALARAGVGAIVCDSHLPATMASAAKEVGLVRLPLVLDSLACIEAAMEVAPVDPVELLPLYPREPEAVTKWRSLKRME